MGWLKLVFFIIVAFSGVTTAEEPPFEVGRTSRWPENMVEVLPGKKYESVVFPSGRRCVWVAVHQNNVDFRRWTWKKFGPYDFQNGTRYASHVQYAGYIVAPDRNPARTSPGQGSSALSYEVAAGSPTTYAFILGPLLGAAGPTPPSEGRVSVGGIWEDENPNSRYVYTQTDNRIQVSGSFVHQGFTCEFSGTGTVNGDKVTHDVLYSKRPPHPAWKGADGRLELTVSPDGQTMTGKWYNNNGSSGAKTLKRRN